MKFVENYHKKWAIKKHLISPILKENDN